MDMSNEAKDTIVVASGVIHSVLPSWVTLTPADMNGIEFLLRSLVAVTTLVFLVHRTIYYWKRTKKLDSHKDNDKDDE